MMEQSFLLVVYNSNIVSTLILKIKSDTNVGLTVNWQPSIRKSYYVMAVLLTNNTLNIGVTIE